MLVREITEEDKQDVLVRMAIDAITARAGEDILLVLVVPEKGEDLIIRPDIPQFSKNIVGQTRLPVTKIASSNTKNKTMVFDHIQTVYGVSAAPFYDMEPPSYLMMTDGPIVASTTKENVDDQIGKVAAISN